MTKSVAIAIIYFFVFCGIYCIEFSIKLVKIAQEVDLVTWLASDATRERSNEEHILESEESSVRLHFTSHFTTQSKL